MGKHIHLIRIWLWVALITVIVACSPSVKVVEPVETPTSELQAIDSLMWRQPDSAFVLLQEFVVSPEAEELETFDEHYCQMLISELLYKNDCEQTNRPALLQAVAYFDSLMQVPEPVEGPFSKCCTFLDARAHYINGVGYYENDSIVKACAEYMKALEVMEERFAEKELVGKKAQFMTYIYNRLGDMFSKQFMMESAIKCYEGALFYCNIEPTSPIGISNIYFRLGKQYDKKEERDKANEYYTIALEKMPNNNNLVFRDLVSTKALCEYRLGYGLEQSLDKLKQILLLTDNESEYLFRFLIIGSIFFEEKMYDSALFYLKPVFENDVDISLRSEAANTLHVIYDSLGNKEKVDACVSFLAKYKKLDWENKSLVSNLEDIYKTHLKQKQEKEAEEARKISIKKTIRVIVPIAVVVVLTILIIAKRRSKKLLKEQQEEAVRKFGESEQQYKEELRQREVEAEKMLEDKEKHHQHEMEAKEAQVRKELEERDKRHTEAIEAERQTHRMEQAAISGRLKRSNQEVRELKDQIKHLDDLAAKTETANSFNEEPICHLILERVHDGQFKSKIDCELYKSYALDKQQLLDLRVAADRHFSQFTLRLRKAYPKLTNIDIDYCCLYLLNLTYADVSALMQRAYNTVVERDSKIQKIIGSEKPLPIILMDIAQNPSSI